MLLAPLLGNVLRLEKRVLCLMGKVPLHGLTIALFATLAKGGIEREY